MIVIGVDVHKHSLTAVAVDQVGRAVAELTVGSSGELVAWSTSLAAERLWAVEDCRQLTGALERRLLAAGESLLRVPPKLMAPERRAGRARGKSDPIDALAVARAALREPRLDRPRPGEAALRELKLLVDHRDDLVDERRRAQQRLRLAAARPRPGVHDPARRARPPALARPRRPPAPPRRTNGADPDRARARRPLPQPHPEHPRARPRAAGPNRATRTAAACAARLRLLERRQTARRARSDRTFRQRCPARPPRRCRTAGGQLRQTPTTPARPWRQPTAQLRPAPNRDHPGSRAPARPRLPRAQAERGEEPPGSAPLPQTTAGPDRLQHAQKRVSIDIGATLAQARSLCRDALLLVGTPWRIPDDAR